MLVQVGKDFCANDE